MRYKLEGLLAHIVALALATANASAAFAQNCESGTATDPEGFSVDMESTAPKFHSIAIYA